MDIDAIYAGIVDGSGDPGDLALTRQKLQRLALERTLSRDPDDRLGALRVASALGPEAGRPVVERLVRDPDPAVRTWAFNQAVASGEAGIPILRDAAGGDDEQIVLAALDLLTRRVDQMSVQTARRLLDNDRATVRAAAARLIGHIAGPALEVQLKPLLTDPDPHVRHQATEAIERIRGDRPRGERENWWDDGPAGLPSPPPVEAGGTRAVPEKSHVPPPPADLPAPDPEPTPEAAPQPAEAPQLPAPTAEPEPEPEPAWDGTTPARLPAQLPTETRALAKLLGMVAPADHQAVVDALREAPPGDLPDLLGRYTAGGDEALGRGLALAMGQLNRAAAFPKLRQMARDPHPGVRGAAIEAIGAVGGASAIPLFNDLLRDPAEEVRVAAVRGLAALCVRIDRQDLGRDYLAGLGEQPDAVAAAIDEARATLEA